mmetsp:Transcript_10192/g.22607  ORF Transcript_10192/g.22607 Transcript_10192/m.22607 type:complete len:229 (-) Transcript_10192:503-1189(-)
MRARVVEGGREARALPDRRLQEVFLVNTVLQGAHPDALQQKCRAVDDLPGALVLPPRLALGAGHRPLFPLGDLRYELQAGQQGPRLVVVAVAQGGRAQQAVQALCAMQLLRQVLRTDPPRLAEPPHIVWERGPRGGGVRGQERPVARGRDGRIRRICCRICCRIRCVCCRIRCICCIRCRIRITRILCVTELRVCEEEASVLAVRLCVTLCLSLCSTLRELHGTLLQP